MRMPVLSIRKMPWVLNVNLISVRYLFLPLAEQLQDTPDGNQNPEKEDVI